MLGSALKISLRTLYREKRYAIINIAGLSLAIACTIILGLYLRSELSYDRHFDNYENIYRIVNEYNANGSIDDFAITSQVLGSMISEDNPDIEQYVRFRYAGNADTVLYYEDQARYWDGATYVSPNVFNMFSHDIVYGEPETALVEPYTVAVSETVARAYFGDENPIGRVLTNDGGNPYTITLVFADLPENTHYKYDVLFSDNIPLTRDPENLTMRRQMLGNVNFYTYVQMREGFNIDDWAAISQKFYDDNMSERFSSAGLSWRSWLQPLKDVHLHSDVGYDQPTGNLYYNYAFIAVAAFILLIACINYMNLSTARSAKRAREVGMRKILGTSRGALIVQFLTESMLYTFLALIAGIVMVEMVLTLTPINNLLGKTLALTMTQEPQLILVAAVLCVVVGLLAGLYPALYLSSWQPLTALVGNQKSSTGSVRFRSALVFLQFTITVTVIACTLLMAAQMKYVSDKELGFSKENKVIVKLRGADVIEQIPVIQAEFMKHPNILGVTSSSAVLGETLGINGIPTETNTGEMEVTQINNMIVAKDFVEVMGLELLEGRSFSTRLLTDIGINFVVNETFVANMGWNEALGKRIANGRVIGVVRDFNYASLHKPIESFAIHTYPDNEFENTSAEARPFQNRNLIVNISGEGIRSTLNFLEEKMVEFDPKHPFEFRFFDDSLDQLYQSEERLMGLVGIFSAICIFIACLGLYGLAAFTTEQRTKEIGIRKVLGASSRQIIALLARNVIGLVLGGAALATAISFLAIDEWLSGFAYRATINPLAFVVATLIAVAIAYITIALQSYRTAQSDPSQSLRHE